MSRYESIEGAQPDVMLPQQRQGNRRAPAASVPQWERPMLGESQFALVNSLCPQWERPMLDYDNNHKPVRRASNVPQWERRMALS